MSRVERELNKRINNTTEIDAETKIKEKKRERERKKSVRTMGIEKMIKRERVMERE